MVVSTYTKSGTKAQNPAKLDKKIFGVNAANHELLKSSYLAYLANGRENFAKTKKRGDVQGGGAKPWRQKGTGRARVGSSRNPIWRGGGVAFGPSGNENYSVKTNTKAKRAGLRQALSLAAKEDHIKVVDDFTSPEGKVKPVINLLKKIDATGKVLLVVHEKNNLIVRATNNLPNIKTVQARYLQVFDILNADNIVITKDALNIIHEWLVPKASSGLGGKDESR